MLTVELIKSGNKKPISFVITVLPCCNKTRVVFQQSINYFISNRFALEVNKIIEIRKEI